MPPVVHYTGPFTLLERAQRAWMHGDLPEACRITAQAKEMAPYHATVRSLWAEMRLCAGEWTREVFSEWNYNRWISAPRQVQKDYKFLINKWPEWDGSVSLEDRTILVWHDGGIGDNLNWSRYRGLLEATGATVIWQRPRDLGGVVEGVDGSGVFAVHCFCPMQSLPGWWGTTPATIPPQWRPKGVHPRLRWPPERVATRWNKNPIAKDASWYSVLEPPDWSDAGVEWVTFPDQGNWWQTFRALESVDLVITVDTSLAHAAGLVGIPVWLILATGHYWIWQPSPDGRTKWYDSVRIYKQHRPKEWTGVLAQVREDLESVIRVGIRATA